MLTLPRSVRVFALRTAVSSTIGIDGLVRIVRDGVGVDPCTGHIFCFFNRHRDRVKLLVWDCNGFWVFSKRLERGRFEQLAGLSRWVEIDREQLVHLLQGIDTRTLRFRRNFPREVRMSSRDDDRSARPAQ